jgi:heterodisulfide reductase subunit C
MTTLDFEFKKKLDRIIGGDLHSYCFQCGACVGDCPTARYSERFNPRLIMLMCIMGRHEELLKRDSVIWECTNCYNCMERCPQDVKPAEVIVALKNLSGRQGNRPQKLDDMVKAVEKTGMTGQATKAINKIREDLGLKPVKPAPTQEILKLLE